MRTSYPVKSKRAVDERLRSKVISDLNATLVSVTAEWDEQSGDFSDYDYNAVRANSAEFHVDTLRSLSDSNTTLEHRIEIARGLYSGWSEEKVMDYLTLSKIQGAHTNIIVNNLRALHRYDGLLPHVPGEPYPAERAEQVTAIFRVTQHMKSKGISVWHSLLDIDGRVMNSHFIRDEKLRGLLTGAVSHREAVVRIITERDIFNADIIKDILRVTTPLLSVGSL